MKKKYLIMALVLFFPQVVLAAPSASISTNESAIENGKSVTVTVTLTDTAAWNIKITGSEAATCSSKQADVTADGKSTTKDFSLSCTSTSEGTINFTVVGDITSGSGETKDISLSKQVTVTRAKSSDNTLSDLKVDGATVPGFSGSTTSYTLKDNSGTSISISAIANDTKASVSGTGSKTLKYGKNTFDVTVTAENGSKKTYNIVVNKPDTRNNNNYLKSLSVNQGTIDFNRNTTNYLIKVEHEVSEVNIAAQAEDSKAIVSGTGRKILNDYVNEFKIIVKAENESTKTYIVKVARKDKDGNYGKLSTDNSVKSISVTGFDIKFNKETKKYNVLVDESVNKIEINVVPNDNKATVTIQNNTKLKSGLNKVIVQVTAENGDVNEYLFNVYKIGEETKKEKTSVEPAGIKEESNKDNNIWVIISGMEFIVIILLVLLLLKRNRKGNNNIDKNNQDENDIKSDKLLVNSNIDNTSTNISSNILNTNNNFNNNLNSDVKITPKKEIDFEHLN